MVPPDSSPPQRKGIIENSKPLNSIDGRVQNLENDIKFIKDNIGNLTKMMSEKVARRKASSKTTSKRSDDIVEKD